MFYKTILKDFVRVPPNKFGDDIKNAILSEVKEKYSAHTSLELGIVISVTKVNNYEEGVIIPGDGASFYETEFEVISLKVGLQESIVGKIRDIADFGAFITLGPLDGMIHVSQTMDDFVSFSKDKALQGKEKGTTLKVGDICRAKIIAISFKDITNPKIGLTMRQGFLGRVDTIGVEGKA
ncbi:MAG: DNA-directed RNA polymerase [Candidatus Woesearchaeota archaeon]